MLTNIKKENKMNIVFIIPTGVGAEMGGHAGDANAVAKLFASVSDIFITHPNVVNASDINEMTENTWYVEGSILDRFLEGQIGLKRHKSNKVLVVCNKITDKIINAVSAGRVTIGLDAEVLELHTPLRMIATMENGRATGDVLGWKELVEQIRRYDFDALAINSVIEIEKEVALKYLNNIGGVNPWGGVEAKASKLIANALSKPVAHAPLDSGMFADFHEIVDPRMAAEVLTDNYLHCVLKGLHKAPRIGKGLSFRDVDVMISAYGLYGRPHEACDRNNIPIIYVRENSTAISTFLVPNKNHIIVENYLEALGVVQAMKIGVTTESIRRPIKNTEIIK